MFLCIYYKETARYLMLTIPRIRLPSSRMNQTIVHVACNAMNDLKCYAYEDTIGKVYAPVRSEPVDIGT